MLWLMAQLIVRVGLKGAKNFCGFMNPCPQMRGEGRNGQSEGEEFNEVECA